MDGINIDEKIKKKLVDGLFTQDFDKDLRQLTDSIKIPDCGGSEGCKTKWITCHEPWNGCSVRIAKQLVLRETGSTAYMLKVLSRSMFMVSGKKYDPPHFTITGSADGMTGRWEDDSRYFVLNRIAGQDKGRLVMGLGPSASGKTYLANMILGLLMSTPTRFISIDGGVYREQSFVYQFIKKEATRRGYRGFTNLVSSSIVAKFRFDSIFDTDDIKKAVCSYLRTQGSAHSLYVPETMSNPLTNEKKIKEYIGLTGDKDYIALLIYQHRTGAECPFRPEYRCNGCVESGRSRQAVQGKKYSDGAYGLSIANGIRYMCEGGIRLVIHNTGDKNRKIIIRDFSDTKHANLFEKTNNVIYLPSDAPLAGYLEGSPGPVQEKTTCGSRSILQMLGF
jgi:energy-coupling factor transporter ATP-binding protein EcfA2